LTVKCGPEGLDVDLVHKMARDSTT
jgi:hypothetical protein